MRPFQKHPDLLPVVIEWFDTQSSPLFVAEDMTGWEYPAEWVTVQPTGGTVSQVRTGTARFDVNVFGKTKPETFSNAMDAVKLLMQMRNFSYLDAVITNVECSYPADISDPITGHPRYVFDVNLSYRTA
jgi:hypothetical protein